MPKIDYKKLADNLSNAEIASLLLNLAEILTTKAEVTGESKDVLNAFAVAAAGYRLASL